MKGRRTLASAFGVALLWMAAAASDGYSQSLPFERLPANVFEALPPSARINGEPGRMSVRESACRTLPSDLARRRIVDLAVQEWGYFGFSVVDQTEVERRPAGPRAARSRSGRRFGWLDPVESARVAPSIGGYWAATPQGSWILERQNEEWSGPRGISSRWRDPWSAAFISWVMCEGGLGDSGQFQRAIAHHTYIDQAIRARDGKAPAAAFTAYDAGETTVGPGDLLCTGSRPEYRSLAERRRQLGVGARTHCDIVVKVDVERARILAIGGNVRGTVSLKLLPGARNGNSLSPIEGEGRRPVFAHLKFRAGEIEPAALDNSPTIRALACGAPPLTAMKSLAIATANGGTC